jgi:probable HAF family extracellular repeat protein
MVTNWTLSFLTPVACVALSCGGAAAPADRDAPSGPPAVTPDATGPADTLGVPPQFTRVDLPGLGGERSAPLDIDDEGRVVGYSETTTGEKHAVLWQKDGTVIDLSDQLGELAAVSDAIDINRHQEILITGCRPPLEDCHIFLWREGSVLDLGPGTAQHLNDAGQAVGRAIIEVDGARERTLVFWDGSTRHELGRFGAMIVEAKDMNDAGQILVEACDYTDPMRPCRDYVWQDGIITEPQSEKGDLYLSDINDDGTITAGLYLDDAPGFFVLSGDGSSSFVEGPRLAPLAISESGDSVVAVRFDEEGWRDSAVVWRDGEYVELEQFPSQGDTALPSAAVSDSGDAIGAFCPAECEFPWQAVYWHQGRAILLDGDYAGDMNSRGDVIGVAFTNAEGSQAIRWDRR